MKPVWRSEQRTGQHIYDWPDGMTFLCERCGAEHDLDEISFGTDAPLQWDSRPEEERSRSLLSGEQREIESGEVWSLYLRGCLRIPVRGTERVFSWGVWCSLSERSYEEICEHWDDPERTRIGPHFGWLCTRLPGYPDTVSLKAMVHQRAVGVRPFVELEPTDHPLAVDQHEGIEEHRLREIVIGLLHGEG